MIKKYLLKILVIIIVLICLIFIIFNSINNLKKANNNKYYHQQEEKLLEASKKYFLNNKDYLPREINNNTRVVLNALVKEGYLKMIKDINNFDCDSYKSYVEVEKIKEDKYLYKAHLVCDKSEYITED